MTVAHVWGRIQAQAVLPIAHEGNVWMFQVPRSAVGRVAAEFWVEDEAGNIGYRAAILQIAHGTIKCIEWLETADLISIPVDRPTVADVSTRPGCSELPHICPRMEA